MSAFGDMLGAIRRILLIEHEVSEMRKNLAALDERERDTRERVIRLEGIVAGAQAAASARRLR